MSSPRGYMGNRSSEKTTSSLELGLLSRSNLYPQLSPLAASSPPRVEFAILRRGSTQTEKTTAMQNASLLSKVNLGV